MKSRFSILPSYAAVVGPDCPVETVQTSGQACQLRHIGSIRGNKLTCEDVKFPAAVTDPDLLLSEHVDSVHHACVETSLPLPALPCGDQVLSRWEPNPLFGLVDILLLSSVGRSPSSSLRSCRAVLVCGTPQEVRARQSCPPAPAKPLSQVAQQSSNLNLGADVRPASITSKVSSMSPQTLLHTCL